VVYLLLAGALLVDALIPPGVLLALPVVPRGLVAVVLAFLPIFFANLVFARRFTDTEDATSAFGANLLGAMIGGCLEYTSLIVGYQALLIIAGLLYAGAFLLLPKQVVLASA